MKKWSAAVFFFMGRMAGSFARMHHHFPAAGFLHVDDRAGEMSAGCFNFFNARIFCVFFVPMREK